MPTDYTPIPEDRTLEALQTYQEEHDRVFHPDIYRMPLVDQIRHFGYHVTKIAGRYADYFDKLDHGETEAAAEIMKELKGRSVDLLVISIILGNKLDLNLEGKYLERIRQLEEERMDP